MLATQRTISTVPAGYSSVTPWIISRSTAQTISFLNIVFGAEEVPNSRIAAADGTIIHAVVQFADTKLLLFDARAGWPATPAFLNLYVQDIDEVLQRAIDNGAQCVTEITTLWFGEKVCRILDPQGNLFWINERVEDVDFTDPEIGKRAASPEAVSGIAYIQRSLDEALQQQKQFFEAAEYAD